MRSLVIRRSMQRLTPCRRLMGGALSSSSFTSSCTSSHAAGDFAAAGDYVAMYCTIRRAHETATTGASSTSVTPSSSNQAGVHRQPSRTSSAQIHVDNTLDKVDGAGGIAPHRQALPYKVFQSALSASGPVELEAEGDFKTPAGVQAAFENSVQARTVGNATLSRYIKDLEPAEYQLAEAAVRGARQGGLRIDPVTHEALLGKLVEAGQLRQAMELYRDMIQHRVTPTSNTYAVLMRLCMDRGSHSAVMTLFDEMERRGIQPTSDAYEVVLTSISSEQTVRWELAVQIFDKVSVKNPKLVTARVYNGMMRVYINMSAFDWRIVYNCYFELRSRHRVGGLMLTWESYELVELAMKKGGASTYRRFATFLDAWFNMTHIKEWRFLRGLAIYALAMILLKVPACYCIKAVYDYLPMLMNYA